VIKSNTRRSALCALLVTFAFARVGLGQSALTFPRVSGAEAEFSLVNPSDSPVDVQFVLRSLDGELGVATANPVRYRIPAREHLAMTAGEVFGGVSPLTWERGAWVALAAGGGVAGGGGDGGGIEGTLIDRTPGGTIETSAARPMTDQLIAVPDRQSPRRVRVVNPDGEPASVTVAVHAGSGALLGAVSESLGPGAGVEIDLSGLLGNYRGVVAVRITSTLPVAAEAAISTASGRIHISGGSATDHASRVRIAAHALFLGGHASSLVLGNPNPEPIRVDVTLSSSSGGPVLPSLDRPSTIGVNIPANGAVTLDAGSITRLPFFPNIDGILRVDSPEVPMTAVFVIAQGASASSYPLAGEGYTTTYYPRRRGAVPGSTGVALVNMHPTPTVADVSLVGARGEALAAGSVTIGPRAKRAMLLTDLFDPALVSRALGFVVRAPEAIHSIVAEGVSSPDMAIVSPRPASWVPGTPAPLPELHSVERRAVVPGSILRFRAEHIDESTFLRFGDLGLPVRQLAPGIPILGVAVPFAEPGYVDVRLVRSDGFESDPVRVLVGPTGLGPVREILGQAFFQKVPVAPDGLRPDAAYALPVAGARVEVFSLSTGALFSTGRTGLDGRYAVPAPVAAGYGVRVLASAPERNLVVADNTRNGTVYSVGVVLEAAGQPGPLVATDGSGVSGAFNIFHVITGGNAFVRQLDPGALIPPLAVFWSPSNSRATIGGTFFDAGSGTAYVLGNRAEDSDEFDDAVILHEYAHMLADQLSRDDSPGGPHVREDVLDPRVAWSEGWANFFSGLVRGDPLYVDTFGPDGADTVVFDLEERLSPGDAGGYWSEFAIHSLLWDLADPAGGVDGDGVQLDLLSMWRAFEDVREGSFVYLPTYLDRLVARVPGDESMIEELARARTIDYEASHDPSVSNPFPRLVSAMTPVTGVVDSKSRNRTNLAQSAHLYAFDVTGGAVSIRLDITGAGPAGDPMANDLDLFLMDDSGRVIARSDRGLNGQSELISTFLPAGRYVVEVRSYYVRAETGTPVFNSGAYRTTFRVP
jgi:hypothetical protein